MKKVILLILLASSVLPWTVCSAEEFSDNFLADPTPLSSSGSPPVVESTAENGTTSKKIVTSVSSWAMGLSTLQWNESLTLTQGNQSATDTANYSGLALSLQREVTHVHWGWNFGGFVGSGRANAGGNATSVVYQKDKQNFTIIALSPRAFYRLSSRVNIGLTALAYLRSIDWPSDTVGLTVDSSKNFTVTALADMNLRLSNSWDFYQGIGPLEKSNTFWKIGLAYRF